LEFGKRREETSEGRSSGMKASPDRPCCVQRGGRRGEPREERRVLCSWKLIFDFCDLARR